MRKAIVRRRFHFLSTVGLFATVFLFVLTTFAGGTKGRIELSSKEIAWLKAHPVILHAPDPDYAPFEFRDKPDHYAGIAPDFLKLVGEKLGVEFKAVPSTSWAASLENVKQHKADLVTVATKTAERSKYMIFTSPYIEFPNVILMREDVSGSFSLENLKEKRMAAIKGWAINTYIQKTYPEIKLYWVANVKAALEAVSKSTADAVLLNRATAGYWRAKTDIANLCIAGETAYIYKLSFASRKDWPQLSKLLEKALNAISESERKDIVDRWIFPFERQWRPGPGFWIGLAGIVVLLLIAGFFAWNLSLQRKVQRRTRDLQTELGERKRAEEKLRESEGRFSAMFEHLSSGAAVYESVDDGEDFVFKAFNPAAEGITHISRNEALGNRLLDLFPHMDKSGLLGTLQRVWKTGREEHIPPFYYKDEKREGWRENRIYKLPTGEVVALFDDVSERKQAEDALRESEERLELAVTGTGVGLWDWNMVDDTVYFSPQWKRMLGYEEHEIENAFAGWKRLWHPDDAEKIERAVNDHVAGKTSVYEVEHRLRYKDGSWRWILTRGDIVKDSAGKPVRWVGTNLDITDIRRLEIEKRQSEDTYHNLLSSLNAGVVVHAPDTSILIANPAASKILGLSEDQMYGKQAMDPQWKFLREDGSDMPLDEYPVNRILSTNEPLHNQVVGVNRPRMGDVAWVLVNGFPQYHVSGQLEQVVINFVDITERKQAEVEKEKLESQLRQAQKMEAMGTLAGGIAHDFNNLLKAIQGRTSIMLMKKDSSHPDIRHLKGIEDNVESAADLTRQLLGFARGGKYEVRPTDLNEVIKKENRMFGRTKKEITIRGKYEKDLWFVEVDRGQIEQVLLNLYVNAWQAMPGGGDLYLETENATLDENYVKPFSIEPGKYVKISVTDTGVGMDKATREKIFEPFFTTKEIGRGTGLGLASAYGIIKNHGGFINVYSEKGHGTTFNIYLPVSEKEVIEEKKPAGDILRGTETVLFVDDEDMIIEIAEEMFEQLGYKVLIARSGKEAIEIYEKNKERIDIVLLDMIMPDMSGSNTYDRMKEIDPDIKVLLSSGYSINGQATEIMDRGCNGFIQKPFKMKELSQKLREILDEK